MALGTFVSFRGLDARQNFISHLCAELRRQGPIVKVDENFRNGRTIWSEIEVAMEEAKISIIVFSKNYPTSEWCLEEVVLILEQYSAKGQIVIPVFYRVSKDEVAKQTGCYAEQFAKYEKENPEKAKKWKDALSEIVEIGGEGHLVIANRPEAKAVDDIVRDVRVKLNQISSVDYAGLYGIESQIQKVRLLLDAASDHICIISIWGMVGIGKSKLGEYVYNQVCDQYERFILLRDPNVDQLKNELLFMRRKGYKKVLVFLDGARRPGQIETLAELSDQFGVESRFIVTTMSKGVFRGFGCNKFEIRTYEVVPLSRTHAHQLLIRVLFGGNVPPEDYTDVLNRVVDYAAGNPQVLQLLAEHLHGKTKLQFEDALEKLKRIQLREIHDFLLTSYDEIEDDETQTSFLDIAFVFEGETREHVTNMLNACALDATNGIPALVDRTLIYLRDGRLHLNSLYECMAREIVRRETPKRAAIRSRIDNHDDFRRLLASNTGKGAVRSICLDLANIGDIQLSPDAFSGMFNLKFIKFYYGSSEGRGDHANVHAEQGLNSLPEELRLLHWHGFPLQSLPHQFDPEKLVELRLPHGQLVQLWEGTKHLKNLKLIDLSNCQKLKKLPDLSQAPRLESIILEGCTLLTTLGPSFKHLTSLKSLCLRNCSSLRFLPQLPPDFENVDIHGCASLGLVSDTILHLGDQVLLFVAVLLLAAVARLLMKVVF